MQMEPTQANASLRDLLRPIAVAVLLGAIALTAAPNATALSAHPCTERVDEYVADMLPNHDEGCGDCTAQAHNHAIRVGLSGEPYILIPGCQSLFMTLPPYIPLSTPPEGNEG